MIEVIRQHGGLERERWTFWFYDDRRTLYVSEYERSKRPTKRHGWSHSEWYSHINRRDSSVKVPPLPDDVRDEALAQFISQLKVEAEFKR
jgi:hypothetical protein